MTKKKRSTTTIVNFILDESGSMDMVRSGTISGFNEYIKSLKKKAEGKILFNLVTFDTSMKQVYENEPIKSVKLTKENYSPDGMTALYDAVVETVEKVAKNDDEKTANLVVIMTDGEENSSHMHDRDCLKEIIEKLEGRGNWTFTFLGSNQDSWDEAGKVGVSFGNTINFDSGTDMSVKNAFRGLAGSTMNFCAMASSGKDLQTDNFYQGKKDLSKGK